MVISLKPYFKGTSVQKVAQTCLAKLVHHMRKMSVKVKNNELRLKSGFQIIYYILVQINILHRYLMSSGEESNIYT